jgi:hypothetical protein
MAALLPHEDILANALFREEGFFGVRAVLG